MGFKVGFMRKPQGSNSSKAGHWIEVGELRASHTGGRRRSKTLRSSSHSSTHPIKISKISAAGLAGTNKRECPPK
jgi:hypothetical protein